MADQAPHPPCACGAALPPGVSVCPACAAKAAPDAALLKISKQTSTPALARRVPGTSTPAPKHEPSREPPLPAPIKGYSFVKRLGSGGMGDVYLARQESLDRLVAIKLLPPELAKDKAYVEGFMREARSAGRVTHENIMGAVDVGESDGRYYFVMEYVKGETLFRLIKQEKQLSEVKALTLARQVSRGLRHAHQLNIIHRDIKPKNILITPEGTAKICDFGLATTVKALDSAAGDDDETVHTTPAYASPEQCRADPLDHRSDIYSLGVSLFEMLTGRRPFTAGTSQELMTKQVTEPPPDPRTLNPQISEGAAKLTLRMLRKHRDERFKDYDELLRVLDGLLGPRTGRHSVPPAAPAGASSGGKKTLLIGGSAAAAAVLILVLALAFRGGPPAPPPAPAPAPLSKASLLEAEVKRLLEEMRGVQKEAQGKHGEYDLVRARWKELEERFAGKPAQALFAAARIDFEKSVGEEAESIAKDLISDADAHLKLGRPAEALQALKKFPVELSATPAGNRVAQKGLAAENAVNTRFNEGLQKATQLLAAEKPVEARREATALVSALSLDAPSGEGRAQMRQQLDEFLRRVSDAEALAANKKPEPAAPVETAKVPAPAKTPEPPVPATPVPPVPAGRTPKARPATAAALTHYSVLRSPAERGETEKRSAAAGWFGNRTVPFAFWRAAAVFLNRSDEQWKLQGPVQAALGEYLEAVPVLTEASDPLTPEQHQSLLELLAQKISTAGAEPVEALQLFALAHLQELTRKKLKVDPALLLQARLGKAPAGDLWGPVSSVARLEMAGMLSKPPGLWLAKAADSASLSPDFATRYLGALCAVKELSFDAAAVSDRWKKLAGSTTDPAWIKICDTIVDRIKAETTCELCGGQGRYACSACLGLGAQACLPCKGSGKVVDPSEGGSVTCTACRSRRVIACPTCTGQKAVKCPGCDGKKTRPSVTGSHFRLFADLALCTACDGSGSLFTLVGFPCAACDGYGRVMADVPPDFARLPAWTSRGREGRLLFYALRWLARHAAPDGSWNPSTWNTACKEPGCKPALATVLETGATSLALVAFLNAGLGPESEAVLGGVAVGPLIKRTINALISHQAADGMISKGATVKPVLENHLAVYALFAAAQLIPASSQWSDGERGAVREAALRALRWDLTVQTKGGGWGYVPAAPSDTWVTSWGAMALLAGKEAGVEIPKQNLAYILQWYDSVTDKKDAHLFYSPQVTGKTNLTGNENYGHHDTLTAFASLARLQIEGRPSAGYAAADKFIEKDLPNPDPLRRDYVYWYFGTLFTAHREQRKGAGWTTWTQALGRELLSLQDVADNCSLGSFPVQERWAAAGGKVYGAAMNALTLTQMLGTRPTPLPSGKK